MDISCFSLAGNPETLRGVLSLDIRLTQVNISALFKSNSLSLSCRYIYLLNITTTIFPLYTSDNFSSISTFTKCGSSLIAFTFSSISAIFSIYFFKNIRITLGDTLLLACLLLCLINS